MAGASGVLVWGCVCMYICPLQVYDWIIPEFTHSLRTFLAHATHDAILCAMEVEDSEDRSYATPEQELIRGFTSHKLLDRTRINVRTRVQRYGRRLTTQLKDERWQDNGDRRRLDVSTRAIYFARWPGGGQHGVVSTAFSVSISSFPRARHEAHDAPSTTNIIIAIQTKWCKRVSWS